MFENTQLMPPDPILGLNQTFQADPNQDKINLSVGVYQDDQGMTPIFSAVKKAEQELLSQQHSKSYIAQTGDPKFVELFPKLMLGEALASNLGDRLSAVMTPGGCGALRMIAEMMVQAKSDTTLWVSNPTWANHYPLLQSAGLTLKEYDYYSAETHRVDFDAMLASVEQIPEGDAILLHGCCHNPTGADLSNEQWRQLVELIEARRLLPFIDVAYQGFGDGLEEDAYGVRLVCERLPEVVIAASCSKNFGLYRERTGIAVLIANSASENKAITSQVLSAARRCYSMSPYHGGGIVGHLLDSDGLRQEWKTELNTVRDRMNGLRLKLAQDLNAAQSIIDFEFVADSKGMFCYLGIPRDDVIALREEFSIYLLESTRINVAGLSDENLPVIVDRVSEVLGRR